MRKKFNLWSLSDVSKGINKFLQMTKWLSHIIKQKDEKWFLHFFNFSKKFSNLDYYALYFKLFSTKQDHLSF